MAKQKGKRKAAAVPVAEEPRDENKSDGTKPQLSGAAVEGAAAGGSGKSVSFASGDTPKSTVDNSNIEEKRGDVGGMSTDYDSDADDVEPGRAAACDAARRTADWIFFEAKDDKVEKAVFSVPQKRQSETVRGWLERTMLNCSCAGVFAILTAVASGDESGGHPVLSRKHLMKCMNLKFPYDWEKNLPPDTKKDYTDGTLNAYRLFLMLQRVEPRRTEDPAWWDRHSRTAMVESPSYKAWVRFDVLLHSATVKALSEQKKKIFEVQADMHAPHRSGAALWLRMLKHSVPQRGVTVVNSLKKLLIKTTMKGKDLDNYYATFQAQRRELEDTARELPGGFDMPSWFWIAVLIMNVYAPMREALEASLASTGISVFDLDLEQVVARLREMYRSQSAWHVKNRADDGVAAGARAGHRESGRGKQSAREKKKKKKKKTRKTKKQKQVSSSSDSESGHGRALGAGPPKGCYNCGGDHSYQYCQSPCGLCGSTKHKGWYDRKAPKKFRVRCDFAAKDFGKGSKLDDSTRAELLAYREKMGWKDRGAESSGHGSLAFHVEGQAEANHASDSRPATADSPPEDEDAVLEFLSDFIAPIGFGALMITDNFGVADSSASVPAAEPSHCIYCGLPTSEEAAIEEFARTGWAIQGLCYTRQIGTPAGCRDEVCSRGRIIDAHRMQCALAGAAQCGVGVAGPLIDGKCPTCGELIMSCMCVLFDNAWSSIYKEILPAHWKDFSSVCWEADASAAPEPPVQLHSDFEQWNVGAPAEVWYDTLETEGEFEEKKFDLTVPGYLKMRRYANYVIGAPHIRGPSSLPVEAWQLDAVCLCLSESDFYVFNPELSAAGAIVRDCANSGDSNAAEGDNLRAGSGQPPLEDAKSLDFRRAGSGSSACGPNEVTYTAADFAWQEITSVDYQYAVAMGRRAQRRSNAHCWGGDAAVRLWRAAVSVLFSALLFTVGLLRVKAPRAFNLGERSIRWTSCAAKVWYRFWSSLSHWLLFLCVAVLGMSFGLSCAGLLACTADAQSIGTLIDIAELQLTIDGEYGAIGRAQLDFGSCCEHTLTVLSAGSAALASVGNIVPVGNAEVEELDGVPWCTHPYDPGGITNEFGPAIDGRAASGVAIPVTDIAAGGVGRDCAFLDSGAKRHYVQSHWISRMTATRPLIGCRIFTAGSQALKGTYEGRLGKLKRVIAVEGIEMNLISVGQLLRDKVFVKICFTAESAFGVHSDGRRVKIADYDPTNGMPMVCMDAFDIQPKGTQKQLRARELERKMGVMGAACAAVANAKVNLYQLIHSRLMGVGKSTLLEMSRQGLMDDLPDPQKIEGADCFCESCVYAKMTKLPFKKKSQRTTSEPLELVHWDVFGDLKPHAMGGERYVLIVVDDYTRAVWAIPIHKKSEVKVRLQEWRRDTETRWSKLTRRKLKVKSVRSDNAGENVSAAMREFLSRAHVDHERTVPGCSASNGVAERQIGVLCTMVRHALIHQRLPLTFWGEAFRFAAHVRNRLPCSANPGHKSPYEMLTQSKPQWKTLRTFGAPCYSFLRHSERVVHAWFNHPSHKGEVVNPKLVAAAERGIYLGPCPHSVGHRIYLPHRGRVLVRRHVIFDERPLPNVAGTPPSKGLLADNPTHLGVNLKSPKNLQKFVGRSVMKVFEVDGMATEFRGRVVDIDIDTATNEPIFGVRYDDGDSEDLTLAELEEVLCRPGGNGPAAPPDASDGSGGSDSEFQTASESPESEIEDLADSYGEKVADPEVAPREAKSADLGEPGKAKMGGRPELAPADEGGADGGSAESPEAPRPVLRRSARVKAQGPKSYMAYFGKALFAAFALLCESAHVTSAAAAGNPIARLPVPQPMNLHSQIPYMHEDMQARASRYTNTAPECAASMGVHWVMAVAESGALEGVYARDVPVPKNAREAMADGPYRKQWLASIESELKNMTDNSVWEIVRAPSPSPKLVNTAWVFKCKSRADGMIDKFKARLCAKGYTQVKGVDFNETFAPVNRAPTLRFQLADAVRRRLHLDQIDFEAAFLQSPIDGDVYLRTPPGVRCPKGYCVKLKKGIYGLKQSAFLWGRELASLLERQGFRRCVADPCLWILDNTQGYITVSTWVDDCVVAYSNRGQWDQILKKLQQKFPMSAAGNLHWCLGMRVRQGKDRSWIELDQQKFIEDMLSEFPSIDAMEYKTVSTPGVHGQSFSKCDVPATAKPIQDKPYRELLGKLNFLAVWTRPDIATDLSLLAKHQCEHYAIHWKALRRVLLYVKNTRRRCIRFSCPDGACADHNNLVGYVDADYAADKDTSKSRTGYVFMLCGAPIVWRSRLQPIVAQSTCEAEYVAANAVAREAEWCKQVYDDLLGGNVGVDAKKPLTVREDNEACILLAKQFMVSQRTKHIRIRYHYVRQQVRDGLIELQYIRSEDNTADLFTKALKPHLYKAHRDTLVKLPLKVPAADVIEETPVAACARGAVLKTRRSGSYAGAAKRANAPLHCRLRPQWQGSEYALRVCCACSVKKRR